MNAFLNSLTLVNQVTESRSKCLDLDESKKLVGFFWGLGRGQISRA